MTDVSISDLSLQDAQDLYRAGRLPEAARLYHEFLRANPRHFEALDTLGMIYFQTAQFEQAQYLLGEAVRIDPFNTNSLCFRGLALLQLKRHEAGIECFDRALSIKPDFIEALANRATALLELNRVDEALSGFEEVLAIDPNHAISWNNRGNAFLAVNRCEDAIKSYDMALAIRPDFPEARGNRKQALFRLQGSNSGFADSACAKGVLLMRERRFEDAIDAFDEALEVKPVFVEAMSNRATALSELKRFEDAVAGFDPVLTLDPSHAISWNNRGNALVALRRFEEAVESYSRALGLRPDLTEASENRMNALFELKRTSRCPPAYMRILFDDFASHYDDTMLKKLDYRGHLHLRVLAERVLGAIPPGWRILDLGCGTGLVGAAFKDVADGGRLDGVDISPRMIEAARRRGIYDDLVLGDLETMLNEPGPAYELILAADTMIYLGDLAPTFAGVAKRLELGGFYIFAVESRDDGGWEQTAKNRFRHSEAYLREQAQGAGLIFVDIMECALRNEANTPVAGFAVALQKPGGA
jgi:predicted TPR repeat methyltransferase